MDGFSRTRAMTILSEKLREIAWDSENSALLHECCDAMDTAKKALDILLGKHEMVGAGASIFQLTTAEVQQLRAAVDALREQP
jgi:hypothetical protein